MRMVAIYLAVFWLAGASVGTGALARPSRAQLGSCLRLASFFKREKKGEYGPPLPAILRKDLPMMTIYDLRNDGEAQSHAGFLRGHKRVENFFAQLVRNARTGVGQAQFHSF